MQSHPLCVCVLCKVVHACSHAMYIYIPSNEQRHSDPECFDAILQKCSSLATHVGKLNLRGERNEVRADERQNGSGKLQGERLKIITADKDQPAHKVSS